MPLHLPTVLCISIAVLAMSAGVMTLFGVTSRIYRGFWWWVAAQWFLALGLVLHSFRDSMPAGLPVANLLVMQWPVVVLAGLRRFYSRHEWRVPALADWLLLTGAFVLWLASWAAHDSLATQGMMFAAGSSVLHLYAAWLAYRLPAFVQGSALKVFGFTVLAGAVVQGTPVLQAVGSNGVAGGDPLLLASSMLMVLSALVMVYLGLLMTFERTEANLRITHRKLKFLAGSEAAMGAWIGDVAPEQSAEFIRAGIAQVGDLQL